MHPTARILTATILGSIVSFASGEPVREGAGERRAALNAMELKRFPVEAWSDLTDWTNGDAPTVEATEGKVILIVSWSSFYAPSVDRGAVVAQRMLDRYGDKGLVVYGVHNQSGWDKAAEVAKAKGFKFAYAHDANGKFRSTMFIDQDPDFYVIDRARQMRYADIETASVEEAVSTLIAESVDDATNLPAKLAQAAADAKAAGRRTDQIRQQFGVADIPAIPPGYVAPVENAYENKDWPKIMKEIREGLNWNRNSNPGDEEETRELPLSDFAFWHPSTPELTGRIRIVYFWHPDYPASYNRFAEWDQLQRQLGRDAVVIGALVPLKSIRQDSSGNREEEDVEKLAKRAQEFIKGRRYEHYLVGDMGGATIGAIGENGKFPIPGAVIASTDGVIRWVGWTNRGDFQLAIDKTLAQDPAVKARREADRRYIESKTK